MAIFKKCCFCCQLTTGAIVLGWFVMISGLLMGIIHSLCLTHHRNIMDFQENSKYIRDYSTAFKFGHGAGAALNFVMAISAILLIIGAMKRKTQLLLPFLITYMFYIVLTLLIAIIVAFASDTGAIVHILSEVIGFCWGIYWWLCVLSLYQEIKEEGFRPRDTFLMRQNQANVVTINKTSAY